jgi:hypothetical protein
MCAVVALDFYLMSASSATETDLAKKQLRIPSIAITILRYWLQCCIGPLAIPVLLGILFILRTFASFNLIPSMTCVFPSPFQLFGALALNITCSSGGIVCSSSGHTVGAILAALLFVLFLAFGALAVSTVYARLPTSGSPLARPHARTAVTMFAIKALLTLVYVLLNRSVTTDAGTAQWILTILCIICMVSLTVTHTTAFPYYHWESNMAQCCSLWLCSWASAVLVLVMVMDTPKEAGVTLLFFVLSPLVAVACFLHVQAHRHTLTKMLVGHISNITECELKTRFFLGMLGSLHTHPPVPVYFSHFHYWAHSLVLASLWFRWCHHRVAQCCHQQLGSEQHGGQQKG